MQLTAYGLTFFLLVMDFTVGIFGGYAGYTVNGVPVAEGGSIGLDSFQFLFDMSTFQVDGMPAFLSAVFLIFNLLVVLLIIRLLRGND